MIESVSVSHHIQKYIIDVLMYAQVARFRDLRPPKTDTNLFTYHLNSLVKNGIVTKVDGGYALSLVGLSYVDRVSTESKTVRTQPKIITMLLIQNSEGDVLLQRRTKQPYINAWTLPYGKLHIDDPSVMVAAKREAKEKLGLKDQAMRHAGDCYIRVKSGDEILSTTLAHVFTFNRDAIETSEDIIWARPHKLRDFTLAPAVEDIVSRGFFNDPFFFEEFDATWSVSGNL
ncbi:MAG TPA: NUDIX hydrolase [Candidatus Microsaccharimonas sp.]|jgi:ADP-ribose pyrophosphatase YjhB (NUDIX family)